MLDFLRGAAAVYVLISHARGAFFAGGQRIIESGHHSLWDLGAIAALQLTSLGSESVVLFFVVSGFAMANSVRYSPDVGRFYLKRFVRIWPPYVAAIGVALAIAGRVVRGYFDQLGEKTRLRFALALQKISNGSHYYFD